MYYAPPLTKVNKIIIISLVAFFLTATILTRMNISLNYLLGLNLNQVFSGLVFKIITYPLVTNSFFEILFDCLMFWFIGGELEAVLGVKKYLLFILLIITTGGLAFLAVSYVGGLTSTYVGTSGIIGAMLLYYAIYNPERTFAFMLIFPIKAKYFCAILIAITLYGGLIGGMANAWGQIGSFIAVPIFIFINRKRNKPKYLHLVDKEYPQRFWH